MLLAVIGDILGNFEALNAALDDIDARGIQSIVHTGNAVAGGARANEVLELLAARGVITVQGAQDNAVARWQKKQAAFARRLSAEECDALRRAYESIHSTRLEELRTLPKRKSLSIDGVDILLCYGSPANQSEVLTEGATLEKLQRQREVAPVHLIVCGGNRKPFHREAAGALFVHPGFAAEGPGVARYTVVDTEESPWRVNDHHIDYTPGAR